MSFTGRDLTDIHCFTMDELLYVLDKAALMKCAIEDRKISEYRLADG